jgi:hypothetical protein
MYARQIDMDDTAANEALTLAGTSDQFQKSVLNLSTQLQQQASNTAPGTADMVQAESAAMQLQSQAVEHRLLASLLRQRATLLAGEMSRVKQNVAGHAAATTATQTLIK